MKATPQNVNQVIREHGKARVRHHLGDSFLVTDAKPLGFGTSSTMVRFDKSTGWTSIDPLTWEVAAP